jgi:hypothetical protein
VPDRKDSHTKTVEEALLLAEIAAFRIELAETKRAIAELKAGKRQPPETPDRWNLHRGH